MKKKVFCTLLFLIMCWTARNPRDEQFFAFLIATIFFMVASVAFIIYSNAVVKCFISASVVYAIGFLIWHASVAMMRNESILELIQDQHSEHEIGLSIFVYSLLVVTSFVRMMFLHFGDKKSVVGTR